jgi:hypothetical protein
LVSNPARLKSYEGSRKVVSPTSKGLTRSSRLGRPFHEHPEQTAIAKGPGGQKISLADKTVNAISAPTSMAICQTNTPSALICLSTAIAVRRCELVRVAGDQIGVATFESGFWRALAKAVWVKNVSVPGCVACPLHPQEQTSSGFPLRSGSCQHSGLTQLPHMNE